MAAQVNLRSVHVCPPLALTDHFAKYQQIKPEFYRVYSNTEISHHECALSDLRNRRKPNLQMYSKRDLLQCMRYYLRHHRGIAQYHELYLQLVDLAEVF